MQDESERDLTDEPSAIDEGPPPLPPGYSSDKRMGIAVMVGLAWMAYRLVVGTSRGGAEASGAYVFGSAIGALLLAALIAAIAYRAKGRSTSAALVAFCVVLTLATLSDFARSGREQRNRAEHRAIENFEQDAWQLVSEMLAEEDPSASHFLERLLKALEKAIPKLRGYQASALDILADELRDILHAQLTYEKRIEEFSSIDTSAGESREVLEAQLSALGALEETARSSRELNDGMLRRVRRRMDVAGVPADFQQKCLSRVRNSETRELSREVGRLDLEIIESLRRRVRLLFEHHGHWEYDEEHDKYTFEDEKVGRRFARTLSMLATAIEDYEEAQSRLRDEMQRKLDR